MISVLRLIVIIAVSVGATTSVIYVILDAERGGPADPLFVEQCRGLARQAMDIAVEAARADLDPNDPGDDADIAEFSARADDLQTQMDQVGCGENPKGWIYGSFQQEMIETERYIADLLRENER